MTSQSSGEWSADGVNGADSGRSIAHLSRASPSQSRFPWLSVSAHRSPFFFALIKAWRLTPARSCACLVVSFAATIPFTPDLIAIFVRSMIGPDRDQSKAFREGLDVPVSQAFLGVILRDELTTPYTTERKCFHFLLECVRSQAHISS